MNQESCLDAQPIMAEPPALAALSLPAAWATCCGALAAGLGSWSGLAFWRLLASWLVADAALGCMWTQLQALKAREHRWAAGTGAAGPRGPLVVPYAEPRSAGARMAALLNLYLARRHSDVWARLTQPALAALVAAGIALVIANFLGPSSLLVVGCTLVAAALVSLATGSNTLAQNEWARGLSVASAWLLGRVALTAWHKWAWLPALIAGLWGYAQAHRERNDVRRGVWLARLAYAASVGVLLAFKQPLLAVALALAAVCNERASWAMQRVSAVRGNLPWLVSALLLALAAPYWA